MNAETVPAKFVFLDVVGFTHNRSVEAQSDIVRSLNEIVNSCLASEEVDKDQMILLPTGDGMCLVFLNVEDPYDIHVGVAEGIVQKIAQHNQETSNEMRQFSVRIGVNANTDNLVTDINNRQNIAGAGINMAARIMGMADENQILVGESVYDTLQYREKYMGQFREHVGTVKHGHRIRIYQYLANHILGLNCETPSAFVEKPAASMPLSQHVAYYMAELMQFRQQLLDEKQDIAAQSRLKLALWLRSFDHVARKDANEHDTPIYCSHNFPRTSVEEQLHYYRKLDTPLVIAFMGDIRRTLKPFSNYFDDFDFKFVNQRGADALRIEWDEIWMELEANRLN